MVDYCGRPFATSLEPMVGYFTGLNTMFHSNMCKARRGTSDTIAKRRKVDWTFLNEAFE